MIDQRRHLAFIPILIANILLHWYIYMFMIYFKEVKINKMYVAILRKKMLFIADRDIVFHKCMPRYCLTCRRDTNILQKVRY